MATKKDPADVILMAQILDCAYQGMNYGETAKHLRRDIVLVAQWYDNAIKLAVSARLAHDKEYYRQLAIGRLERQMRKTCADIEELEGACSLKIKLQIEYRSQLKEWGILHGLDKDIIDIDALPPLLEIRVQQIELEMPPN